MEIVVDLQNLCGETPVWDPRQRRLLWADIAAGSLFEYRLDSGEHRCLKENFPLSGIGLNREDGYIIGNADGFFLWDGGEVLTKLQDYVDKIKVESINDTTVDKAGRFIGGSCYYDEPGEYPLGHLFSVDLDGTISIIEEGLQHANGIAFSPDDSSIYYSDSTRRLIYVADYQLASGQLKNRRVLVELGAEEGLPDGICVDEDGFIWCAQWFGSCISRYDPEGKLERKIETPAKQTASLHFGGDDYRTLFITSAGDGWRSRLEPPGFDGSAYQGGALYMMSMEMAGLPTLIANIQKKN